MKLLNYTIIIVISLLINSNLYSQNLVVNGNMENETDWAIYDLSGAGIMNYTFNYTGDSPSDGTGGCLRVIGDETAGFKILFWQTITFTANKTYILDGSYKSKASSKNFYTQITISDEAPVEGSEYKPNAGTGDATYLGISTWKGCSAGEDGLLADLYCQGKGKFFSFEGAEGEEKDFYYAIRFGSSTSHSPADNLEILLDELTVELYENWLLSSTANGVIDNVSPAVNEVNPTLTVAEFKNGLSLYYGATLEIVDFASQETIPDQEATTIDETMGVLVRGNQETLYAINLRPLSTSNDITWAFGATIDNGAAAITNFPPNIAVVQIMTGLKVSQHATYKVLGPDDLAPTYYSYYVGDTLKVEVTAENDNKKIFTITLGSTDYNDVLSLSGETNEYAAIENQIINVSDNSIVHITDPTNILDGSIINLVNGNTWVYFDNIKPSVFIDNYLKHISLSGENAENDVNVRVSRYINGTLIITHQPGFAALTVYDGTNLTGSSMIFANTNLNTDNEPTSIGDFDNKIKSFVLKKGYMATLAHHADGTGYSRVYIADEADLVINELPENLIDEVSFIKVFTWSWPTKKGYTNKGGANTLNASWIYNWGAGGTTNANVEYVPMRHNPNWPGWGKVSDGIKETHVLGFNEPDRPDQANMSVEQMIEQWPNLLKTGFRIGSPSPSDGGLNKLFSFIDRCEEMNLRVDFIAMHWYMGGQTPQQMYNRLKYIHDRCGKRPIWITEWNNGANWTDKTEEVTQEIQVRELPGFLEMLENTDFVERYAIYNWVGSGRAVIKDGVTPSGEIYRDLVSKKAFNPNKEYTPKYVNLPAPYGLVAEFIEGTITISWSDQGSDHLGYIIEKSVNDGDYEVVKTITTPDLRTYDDNETTSGTIKYKIKSYDSNAESGYSNVGSITLTYSVGSTQIQTLNAKVTQSDKKKWNYVLFSEEFSEKPIVVAGALTNVGGDPSTIRVKNVTTKGFEYIVQEWDYLDGGHNKEETIAFLALTPGSYDFGGIKAYAFRDVEVTEAFKTVNFPDAFGSQPVLLGTQVTNNESSATALRLKSITVSGCEYGIQEEEKADNIHSAEEINFVALTQGAGNIFGHLIEVGNTGDEVTDAFYSISFVNDITEPGFFAQIQTMNEVDPATIRMQNLTTTGVEVKIAEEDSKKDGLEHAAETVGWFVIADIDTYKNTTKTSSIELGNSIDAFPNPVKRGGKISIKLPENIDISNAELKVYTIDNKQVVLEKLNSIKQEIVIDLKAGIYILAIDINNQVINKKMVVTE